MDYEDPPWAAPPPEDCRWFLTEIKGGVEVARHPLKRPCTAFGRAVNEDAGDVPILHDSASRMHARIAFDALTGHPWLKDLQSTHGTKVNKRPLPPQAIGRGESMSTATGARGCMVYPGDVLQFGASTRIFCLEGPESYERGAIKLKQKAAALAAKQAPVRQPSVDEANPVQQEDENDAGVSWGMDMSDPDPEDDGHGEKETSNSIRVPMQAQVPEKHQKALEKLNALKFKLDNLRSEDERIRRKGELSEGQEKQLQRNQERESELEEKIASQESELYYKLHPEERKVTSTRKRGKMSGGINRDGMEDDSDFYDRTKKSGREEVADSIDSSGESEKSLTAKWIRLHEQQRKIVDIELSKANEEAERLNSKLVAMKAANDEEAFFVQNDLDIAKEKVAKNSQRLQSTLSTMSEMERLLKIINPKLIIDREAGYIGINPPVPKSVLPSPKSAMMPPPSKKGDSSFMPPPHIPSKESVETSGESNQSSDFVMPPPKRKRVIGPSMTRSPAPEEHSPTSDVKASNRRPQAMGTLAMLNAMTSDSKSLPQGGTNHNCDPTQKPSDGKGQRKEISVEMGAKEDRWVAPKGQDGSGITKLNAKFAGRY